MSKTIKFTIEQDQYEELENESKMLGISIQDVIRKRLFNEDPISIKSLIEKAKSLYKPGEMFNFMDVYENKNGSKNGPIGSSFKKYVLENDCGIEFLADLSKKSNVMLYKIK